MRCPYCEGEGGHQAWGDGWSEWEDCYVCKGKRRINRRGLRKFDQEQRQLDADIDAQVQQIRAEGTLEPED